MPVNEVAATRSKPNWPFIIGFAIFHLASVAGILYLVLGGFAWPTLALAIAWYFLSGFSITGGYHRLFSHRAYQSSRLLRWFYVLFGAASFQMSAIDWSSDHRRHHAAADGPDDPYSVTKGFWWAHMNWLFVKRTNVTRLELVRDLTQHRSLMFQHKFFLPLAVFMGFLLPALIASLWGDFWGGLLIAGGLRLTALLHATWCINSLAHTFGAKPFDRESTAVDNPVVAVITFGEGYHNFHHKFQADYRNALRWWQYDPTKWIIWTASKFGLARDLRRTPERRIEKAREIARQQRRVAKVARLRRRALRRQTAA